MIDAGTRISEMSESEARVHFAKCVSFFKLYDKTKMCLYFFLW